MSKQLEIPVDVELMRGWDALKPTEQAAVRRETDCLLEAFSGLVQDKIRIGEHLSRLRDVLEPKKLFERYLKADGLRTLRISRATAYRHIANYRESKTINRPYVQLALMRGDKIADHAMIVAHAPAKTRTIEDVGKHLDTALRAGKHTFSDDEQAEILMRECYNYIRNRFERLPDSQNRGHWMRELCGMQLTLLGVGTQQQLGPVAVPDNFKAAPVGRPRTRKHA